MTVILLKLFLMFFVTLVIFGYAEVHNAGKFGEYLLGILVIGCMIFLIGSICSFIWFL